MDSHNHSLLRLLHLVSPSLPTGAFAYSQGLEWAIDAGWVQDGPGLQAWLEDLMGHTMVYVDIPLLKRMLAACRAGAETDLDGWCDLLLALRESMELRQEEAHRGRAMAVLLEGLEVPGAAAWRRTVRRCQLAGFALAAAHWRIPVADAAAGYLWAWLENQVLVGIKNIPLGQTEGHRILSRLDAEIATAVAKGLTAEDAEIGASSPTLALACSFHETQYTRLYRS